MDQCNFLFDNAEGFSSYVFEKNNLTLLKIFLKFDQKISSSLGISIVIPLKKIFLTKKSSSSKEAIPAKGEHSNQNFQPGEWVQTLSVEEVLSTLDDKGKLKGLYFMPEMKKFCGKKFKVYKRVEKIKLETTGEMRKLKTPSIFLQGVECDGEFNGWCDRSCYLYWREDWLKRI